MSSTVPSPTSPTADRRTHGTRASTTAQAARASEVRAARATRARRVRLTARASVLAVVAMIVLTLSVAPLRTLLDQRSELSTLEQQTKDLAFDNAVLKARIAELNDPAYLERLARECLGMVKPGETAFVVIPRKGPPPSPQC
jgi:cell division protein FtsB